jgi:Fur family transcriptional regulator, iron response regulator
MVETNTIVDKLRFSGLRPTKQRISILKILFESEKTFHFTIDGLKKSVEENNHQKISLATIYNTVHALKKKGYLKEIPLDGNKTYYDTNISTHHHFFDEDAQTLSDIDENDVQVVRVPESPENKRVKSVEVLIRVASDNQSQK